MTIRAAAARCERLREELSALTALQVCQEGQRGRGDRDVEVRRSGKARADRAGTCLLSA